jgi:hypothetical protein
MVALWENAHVSSSRGGFARKWGCSAKAISVKENTILLVFLFRFGVAPAVTYLAMRLLSRLEAKQSRRYAVPAALGHRSWASCPSRSLLIAVHPAQSGIFFSGNRLNPYLRAYGKPYGGLYPDQ